MGDIIKLRAKYFSKNTYGNTNRDVNFDNFYEKSQGYIGLVILLGDTEGDIFSDKGWEGY